MNDNIDNVDNINTSIIREPIQFYFDVNDYNRPVKIIYNGDALSTEINEDNSVTFTQKFKISVRL